MAYEIDYIPVGNNESTCTGDAISMRFWDGTNPQVVLTVDGGNLESGKALADSIKEHYDTDEVLIAFLTHPDMDHASGLRMLIHELKIRQIIAVVPWNYAGAILHKVREADPNATVASITKALQEQYPALVEVLAKAEEKKIPVLDPLQMNPTHDLGGGVTLHMLGPSRDEYVTQWLCGYDCLPQQSAGAVAAMSSLFKAAAAAIKWVQETWDKEHLVDPLPGDVNCVNNSSLVFALEYGGQRFLFTGDAGVPAIDAALDRGAALGMPSNSYGFFDVPHHGSRRNLGPTLLNKLFGPPRSYADAPKEGVAFISAPPNDHKHPSRRITNALNRRARTVISTDGSAKCQFSGSWRNGWSQAIPVPHYDQVEEVEAD